MACYEHCSLIFPSSLTLNAAIDGYSKIFCDVGEFNADGKLDLVISGSGPLIFVFLGSGDATFQLVNVSNSSYDYEGCAAGDFNGDGRLDIAATNFGFPSSIVVLLQLGIDDVPPATSANPSPSPNLLGWNKTSVTVNLSATDNLGGSGIKQIRFNLAGAQNTNGWQAVNGNTAAVQISA